MEVLISQRTKSGLIELKEQIVPWESLHWIPILRPSVYRVPHPGLLSKLLLKDQEGLETFLMGLTLPFGPAGEYW